MTESCHIDQIGVLWMNANFADMAGLLQSNIRPSFTAIGGLIHPIAVRDIEADGGFAGAGIDNVGICVCHRDGTYRSGIEESV